MDDSDAGQWTYQVNGLGDVVQQVDANGQCTRMDLDGRGRMWRQRAFSNSACTGSADESTWAFDTAINGIGALATESNATASHTPSYDALGRVEQMQTEIDGVNYVENWTFDEFGRAFQYFFTVPGAPTTGEHYVYNDFGYPLAHAVGV